MHSSCTLAARTQEIDSDSRVNNEREPPMMMKTTLAWMRVISLRIDVDLLKLDNVRWTTWSVIKFWFSSS